MRKESNEGMGTIFAIGGGEIGKMETLSIDRKIVESSKKNHPKVLFIPTASEESKEYIEVFNNIYGKKLGCKTDVLLLLNKQITSDEIRRKIMSSDIVYVGGGNTRKMMEVWKMHNVDDLLIEAYKNGIIMSGLSAGSICWFKSGISDSESFEKQGNWSYIRMEGLNLIPAMHCPHYNEESRRKKLIPMLSKYDEIAIAIENNCAIEFKNDVYKIHKSNDEAKAYKIYLHDGKIREKELSNNTEYKPLRELLTK